MKNLHLHIEIDYELYTKNPDSSELGKKIISNSISLIHQIGFEKFNFKKLGLKINSPESSIYRYFENKHKLLVYLSSWYWSWMEYKLVFATANISDASEKLKKAITIVTEKVNDDASTTYINESLLNKIIIAEFTKTLHTKEIDAENKEGFFLIYKRVISRLILIVNEVNPEYHEVLKKNGLSICGLSPDGTLAEFIELPNHPYFIATQAHPELKSSLQCPAPLFKGLVAAAKKKSEK